MWAYAWIDRVYVMLVYVYTVNMYSHTLGVARCVARMEAATLRSNYFAAFM